MKNAKNSIFTCETSLQAVPLLQREMKLRIPSFHGEGFHQQQPEVSGFNISSRFSNGFQNLQTFQEPKVITNINIQYLSEDTVTLIGLERKFFSLTLKTFVVFMVMDSSGKSLPSEQALKLQLTNVDDPCIFHFFSGILLGVAIRTRKPISINLAPFIWKLILNCNLSVEDIKEVDFNYAHSLASLAEVVNVSLLVIVICWTFWTGFVVSFRIPREIFFRLMPLKAFPFGERA